MGVKFPSNGVSLWDFHPSLAPPLHAQPPFPLPPVLVSPFRPLVLPLLCRSGALAQHDAPCVGCGGLFCWCGLAHHQKYCRAFQAISQDGQHGPIVSRIVPSPPLTTWAWVLGLDTPCCFPFGFTLSSIIYSQTFGIEARVATSTSSTLVSGGYRRDQCNNVAPIPNLPSVVPSTLN